MASSRGRIKEWEALIDPIPKLAVPFELLKQITFIYDDGQEIIVDIPAAKSNEIQKVLIPMLEERYNNAVKVNMTVDVKKVRAFIEPITTEFLSEFFS